MSISPVSEMPKGTTRPGAGIATWCSAQAPRTARAACGLMSGSARHGAAPEEEEPPPSAGEESDPASLSSAPSAPHQLLLLSRSDGSSGREPAAVVEIEASRDLARMVALHGYDPSVVEDDYFRSFVRRLNPGFELPSHDTIEELCDCIYDETRDDLFSRISNVPGRVSLSVGAFTTMQGEVLYTACHFIDHEWNLHRAIMDAYVDRYPDGDFGPLLGVRQLPLSINTPRSTEDCIAQVTFYSQRGVLDNLFMMLWETKRDNMNRLRNQIEKELNAKPTRTTLVSTASMDKVIHSITGEVMVHTTSNYKITADLDDLRLTRQKRQKILSELGLDYNLWAYDEVWYWIYCSLEVLRKEGSTLADTGSEFAELLCKLCGEIHHAIQRISTSRCPTSNMLHPTFRRKPSANLYACQDKFLAYSDI
jgi:hypothetical protein